VGGAGLSLGWDRAPDPCRRARHRRRRRRERPLLGLASARRTRAAAASDQSRPLASRAELLARIADVTARASGGDIARPKRWGGYRIWAERVELWVGQPGRAHDRARWIRPLTRHGDGFSGGGWAATRLMP